MSHAISDVTEHRMDLWDALERGDVDDVQEALKSGASANARAANGYRALDVAAEMADASNDVAVLEALLDAGARVSDVNAEGFTALFFAVQHDHPDIPRLLLARGADVNARNAALGITPLFMAARHGSEQAATVLLDAGADVNAAAKPAYAARLREDWRSHLEMMRAMFEGEDDAYGAREVRVHEALLDAISDDTALTPVLVAAASGHQGMVTLLLARGAESSPLLEKLRALHA